MATTTSPPRTTRAAPPGLLGAALGTVYLAWGATYLAVMVMVTHMPALVASGTRALAAGGLLAVGVAVWRGRRRLRVTRPELGACVLIGLLLPVGGQGLVAVAEQRGAASGLTALIVAAVPLWVVCLRALGGERPPARSVIGILIGFVGVAALIGAYGIGGVSPTGALLLVVLASISWALGSWLQPRLRLPADPWVVVVYEMLVGGSVLCALGVARGEELALMSAPPRAWAAWAFLVVVGSILALTAYHWLLQVTSVSVVSTYAYVNPVVALWLGWLVLREPVTHTTLAAAAVIVVGVAMVITSERRRA